MSSPTRSHSPFRRLAMLGALTISTIGLTSAVVPAPAGASLAGTKVQRVDVRSLTFQPAKVTVKVGTRVDWVWRERIAHNVIFKDKKMSSKVLNKGTYSYTFTKTGTFKYDCTLHPGMKGEIKVQK